MQLIEVIPAQVWNSGPAIIAAVVIFAAEGMFLWWLGRTLAPFTRDFLNNQKKQTEAMTSQSMAIAKLVEEMARKQKNDDEDHRRILLTLKVLGQKLDELLPEKRSERFNE